MANNVTFLMDSKISVTFNGDGSSIAEKLTASTVNSITVAGDPWVFFESLNYGGSFVIFKEGDKPQFPTVLKIIQSVRRIKGGIDSSQVILYPNPFFEGHWESFQRKTPQLVDKYFSLKVTEGAVIFFEDENYTGEQRILLNGDEVQNFTAVKLTSIGKSMKTAGEIRP